MSATTAGLAAIGRGAGEKWSVRGRARLEGAFSVPGDKSIAHRALVFAALSRGVCTLRGMPAGEDVGRTRLALEALGVWIETNRSAWHVHGVGLRGLRPASAHLECGNSGTTMRLLCGLLAGQPFESVLVGDPSLSRRPMLRVADPLRSMGARIECLGAGGRPPLRVGGGGSLRGTTHEVAIDSAQVRSALLLAGLHATGPTILRPEGHSRDHTQRLLRALGVRITSTANGLVLHPTLPDSWSAFDLEIPGDLSSAAFAIAFAAAVPGSRLQVDAVGLNPGRRRILELLQSHGAALRWHAQGEACGEPWGSVDVRGGPLHAMQLTGDDVVRCIDEIPALVAAYAVAGAAIRVRDAVELRRKESDRLHTLALILAAFGATVREHPEGLDVESGTHLRAARVVSEGDHRIAMAAAMLALGADGRSVIEDVACVRTSYPEFAAVVRRLTRPAQGKATRKAARGIHPVRREPQPRSRGAI